MATCFRYFLGWYSDPKFKWHALHGNI